MNNQPIQNLPDLNATQIIMDGFLNNDYRSLVDKYGEKKLLEIAFSRNNGLFSFYDDLSFERHIFILQFWPSNLPVSLDNYKRKKIINLITALAPENTNEQVQAWLSQIDQNLKLPANWDDKIAQQSASKIYNAFNNLETLLLNVGAVEYLPDTLNFYKINNDKLLTLQAEINLISIELDKVFQNILQTHKFHIDDKLTERISDIFKQIGRSQLFVSSERENTNISQIVDVFLKLDTASKAAIELKKQNVPSEEVNKAALLEIKNILKPGLQI